MSRRTCPQCGYVIDEPARLRCPDCFGRIQRANTGSTYLTLSLVGAFFIVLPLIVPPFYRLILLLSAMIWLGFIIDLLVVIVSLFNVIFLGKRYGIALIRAYVVVAATFLLIGIVMWKFPSPAPWV